MTRPTPGISLVLFIACLCNIGCLGSGKSLLSLNRTKDENEKLVTSQQFADSRNADNEIPNSLNMEDPGRSRFSRWLDKIRNPRRITLPRTDKKALLTSTTDDSDPTSF